MYCIIVYLTLVIFTLIDQILSMWWLWLVIPDDVGDVGLLVDQSHPYDITTTIAQLLFHHHGINMAEPSPDYVDLGKASIHGCSTSESHEYMLTLSRPLYNTRPSIMSYRSLGVDVRHLWGLCCITYLYGNNHRGCHLSDILLKKNYGWGGGGMELRSFIGVGPGHPLVHARH